MNERRCDECIHHTDKGCSSWECRFEERYEFCKEQINCDECRFSDFGKSLNCCFDRTSYEQGRADERKKVIEEYTEVLRPIISNFKNAIKNNPYAFIDLDKIAEQLKD